VSVPVGVAARAWGWHFAGRRAPSLHDLTFAIAPGERILLSGPSGCGKSTLLMALAGVLGADQGTDAGELLIDAAAPDPGRRLTGLVLQDPETQVIMERVGDDVAFGCENFAVPRDEMWRRVTVALESVGLVGEGLPVGLDTPTGVLSGGQKQRLALAGVMAFEPGLLLLDEPTANLDPQGVLDVVAAVTRVVNETGCTLVVIDHNPAPWEELLTRVISLDATGGLASERAVYPRVSRARLAPTREPGDIVMSTRNLVVGRPGQPGIAVPDLTLRAGTITALAGVNGSGKSTLSLTLGGLLSPQSGRIIVGSAMSQGLRARHVPSPHRWPAHALVRRVGSVFQSPENQFVQATARAEVALGLRVTRVNRQVAAERVDSRLELMGLSGLEGAHPFTLSGGQKRRLALVSATVTQPHLVVVDEPTFGQDDDSWADVVTLLDELAHAGSAVVITTHDPDLLAVADEIVALSPRVPAS
jgi:energy-coupling factor transport system ATP-binding protein